MNILAINGSPKGERSNTFKLTSAFLEGLNSKEKNFVRIITISEKLIEPCKGCYACWTKSPGKCVINDDMAELTMNYLESDLIIWSFPLYYFSMPSGIKGFMDRLLPMNMPEIKTSPGGGCGHPSRYDLSRQRHILISTCGFHSVQGNYDALLRQFEILFGDKLSRIICPEGELFRVPYLSARTNEYLSHVKKAGEEFILHGTFSSDTQDKLNELLYPPDVFMDMANADRDIAETSEGDKFNGGTERSYKFMRQMAAIYNPASYTKDIILEMSFTDISESYQLLLGKDKCVLKTEGFAAYTTKIETPFETWLDISEGKISGSEAMMQHLYKVYGDFNTMLKMGNYFGGGNKPNQQDVVSKSSNMAVLLLPFLAMWILFPIDAQIGGIACIVSAAMSNIMYFWWKPTPYERIGSFTMTLLGLYSLICDGSSRQVSLTCFIFGVIWLGSSFLKVPLSAYYSCKGYGGESAFKNALFIKTNRILTTLWGAAYLSLCVASLIIAGSSIEQFWAIITNSLTFLLGLFTKWFSMWYPSSVAKGKFL